MAADQLLGRAVRGLVRYGVRQATEPLNYIPGGGIAGGVAKSMLKSTPTASQASENAVLGRPAAAGAFGGVPAGTRNSADAVSLDEIKRRGTPKR